MKVFSCILLFAFISLKSYSQITKENLNDLKKSEKMMITPAVEMIQGYAPEQRVVADSVFTRQFVNALKINNSFYYPFDSIETISKLYPPDSSFRIFTWQLVINENSVRQHGAIQMKTNDGTLKLFPLIDKSSTIDDITDTVTNNFSWIGAVYYKLIPVSFNGKTVYTLIGYDENNIRTSRKIVEILDFKNGQPVFGGNYFVIADGKIVPKPIKRYVMEFKKMAGPRLTFDNDLDMIIMEHLISETNEPEKKWTLVGDGDYEGLKWKNGKWVFINKVFNEVTPEGKPPTPKIIRDDAGNVDETQVKGYEKEENVEPVKKGKGQKKN